MPPVTLGPHFEGFVRDQIARGRFQDESEVIRAGLRLLEDRESLLSDHREDLLRTIDAAFEDPRPSIPAGDAFARLRAHHADRVKAADRGD